MSLTEEAVGMAPVQAQVIECVFRERYSDFVVREVGPDGAVARAGHARMAVASVFNSPLFSQINALGVPVAYYCYFHGPLRIALDPQAVLSFAVVAASILATALVAREYAADIHELEKAFAELARQGAPA